jgi:hypothetical protein
MNAARLIADYVSFELEKGINEGFVSPDDYDKELEMLATVPNLQFEDLPRCKLEILDNLETRGELWREVKWKEKHDSNFNYIAANLRPAVHALRDSLFYASSAPASKNLIRSGGISFERFEELPNSLTVYANPPVHAVSAPSKVPVAVFIIPGVIDTENAVIEDVISISIRYTVKAEVLGEAS